MNREEHLQWCKDRALQYLDNGDISQTLISMFSNLGKHSETENHIAIGLGIKMQVMGLLSTEKDIREFINGFN